MTLLLSVTIKITFLTLTALAVTALLRRRSAAVRHWVLATTVFACVCILPMELLLPEWPILLPKAWSGSEVTSSLSFVNDAATPPVITRTSGGVVGDLSGSRLPRLAVVLGVIWSVGVGVGIGLLAAGLARLRRLALGSRVVSSGSWRDVADEVSRRYGVRRPVRVLCCHHPTLLATWGWTRPTILLPEGALAWAEDRVHAVLRHELAHVARGDWIVILTANVLRAVNWFNPLLWLTYRRLRHESERACDDLVLLSGISGSAYAAHLLDIARECAQRRHPWSPAIAIAHHSMLERRVRAMLNARVNREPLTVFMRAATVAVIAVATVCVGVVTLSGDTGAPTVPPARVMPSGALPVLPAVPERSAVATARPVARAATQGAGAQGGTIEGVLYDQYGGLLPGASVKLTQVGTGTVQNGVTDRGGSFAFRNLPSGDYELVTDLPGFITVKNVLRTEAGATVRRHIMLPIGTVEETIHVTCSRSDLSSSRPTAPTASTTPGAARGSGASQRGVEPKIPGTFTGGIGGQIMAPRKLVHVNPVCPSAAEPEQTAVRLEGRIGIDGLFTDLHAVSSDAQPAYAASALEASRKWVFTPTLLNGAPIEVNIKVTVSYSWN
jgi:beta-lactamase regulating signal transducer with metallopeptidase domain